MDKTIKINLGGTLFQIDEEAYKMLRQYLHEIDVRLKYTQGGAETIEDIETRIAEIFQTQKGLAGVITRDNVEAMISMIGKPEDFEVPGEGGQEREPSYQSPGRKKLYRNPDDTIISGVCGGIGANLNIESVWVRLIFILFTCFFGIGFFVYIALWIALPYARSDSQMKEMYGTGNINLTSHRRGNRSLSYTGRPSAGSPAGDAFNEVFRAIGKVFYIILRIFLIIIGITFVVAGFITLISFIMVIFFKYPGYFSTDSFGVNIFYLPDFLNYVVNPGIAPWILILTFIVVLMPLLALIYWGVRMIFWFKARDGIVSLAGLVIWVISVAALSLILFNEGISFTETAKTVSTEVINKAPVELYIYSGKKVSDLNFDKEISTPEDGYNIYFIDEYKGLYISTNLSINHADDNSLKLNVRKRSTGRSRPDATRKAEGLEYNYKISGDTIYLDEYFTVPAGNKWSFDNVGVNLYIPEGTVVHFDETTVNMFHHHYDDHRDWDWDWDSDSDNVARHDAGEQWEMTENGLKPVGDQNK
ncbi:MAG: PspC domain-containing protein [Bacteroidales bacterium]